MQSATVFSTREFTESWCRALGGGRQPVALHLAEGEPGEELHFIRTPVLGGLYKITSGSSSDFCTSFGGEVVPSPERLQRGLQQLQGLRTVAVVWRVRFDHGGLARSLHELGLSTRPAPPVHVLQAQPDYDRVFGSYHPHLRRDIRIGQRRGVTVRSTCEPKDILAYHEMYSRLAQQKGWAFSFPAQLTLELVKCPELARFLVAEYEGTIIGGNCLLRDGQSVFGLHQMADRAFNHLYPAYVLMDAVVRWACESGARFVNLGSSGSNQNLACFKSKWGTHLESNWEFLWENPLWKPGIRLQQRARTLLQRQRAGTTSRPPTQGACSSPRPSSPQGEPEQALGMAASTQPESGAARRTPPGGAATGRESAAPSALLPQGPLTADQWPSSKRAALGELQAVCVATGSNGLNLMMHGAHLCCARQALARARRQGVAPPVVLDYGCGNGRMLRFFARQGCTVLGTDISPEMLEAARRYGLPPNLRLWVTAPGPLPLLDSEVDVVWVCAVLKYVLLPLNSRSLHGYVDAAANRPFVPTYTQLAAEMYRILKPGGLVAQVEMYVNEPVDTFRPGFEQAGFRAEQVCVVRRYASLLERLGARANGCGLPAPLTVWVGELCAQMRRRIDNPHRPGADFRDYLFIWRKPATSPAHD